MTEHNYKLKIQQLIAEGKLIIPAGVYKLDITHEDSCKIFLGGFCNCDPEIELVIPNVKEYGRHKGTSVTH